MTGAGPENDIEMLARDRLCPCPAFLKLIELRDARDFDARLECIPGLLLTRASPPIAASRPLFD